MSTNTPPPGWYPDPEDRRRQRYWTGRQWVDYTGPVTVTPQGSEDAGTRWWWALPVGVVVLLLLVVLVPGGSDDAGKKMPPSAAGSSAPVTTIAEPTSSAPPEPVRVQVPVLRGSLRPDARSDLRAAGLPVGRVVTSPSARPVGTVLQQDPRAGRRVDPKTPIDLVVARPLPRVPNLVGLLPATARTTLVRAGFRIVMTTRVVTSGADNVVLSQRPAAGTPVRPDATIAVVLSDLHVPPPPPAPLASNCTAGYSPCLTPASDYDCAGGSGDGPKYVYGTVRITGSDPYDLDADGDGLGCD